VRITRDQAFEACDVVETDFSGKITRHIIAERFLVRNSQTGVCYRVVPPVPKAGGATSKIDHGWLTRVGRIVPDKDGKIEFIPDKHE
jgi:hypothetical protein